MASNHSFAKIEMGTAADMAEAAEKLFKIDGAGSLFVRDRLGGQIDALTLHGRRDLGREDLMKWADSVRLEDEFERLMAA